MKEHNLGQEFHKLPADPTSPAAELTQLPAEYTVPQEYPISKPQAAQTKRSHAKQIIAMCLAGFVAIQLLFSYFVPPTKENGAGPTTPGVTPPSGDHGYDIDDFSVRPLPDDKDDTQLRSFLATAADSLENFDFVRASLALYNSMMEQRTGISPYVLDEVGYSVSGGVASDFNAQADACHIYYQSEEVWFENKIGELESYMALRGMLVLMEQASGGTLYRVVSIRISMEQAYGLYGSDVSYYAQYIEGVFDDAGTSRRCEMIEFQVYESDNANLDGVYNVWGDHRLTGPVANGAFMNGTLLESEIVYDESGDFVENEYKPGCRITVNSLLSDGCLNLNDPSVKDQTTSYQDDAWEVYNADETIRYLAYTTYVLYKYDGSDDGAELYGLDITKPLLPIDMHTAFCIRQLVTENEGKEEDPIPGLNPDLDLSVFETGFCTAAQQLMLADYVGAAVTLSDCLRANYEAHGSYQLDNAYLVSVDGQLSAFAGQDLTDGSGVYIRCANEIVQVYNPKVDEYDPELHFIITLIYAVDTGKGGTYTQVLTLNIASYYLGDYDAYHATTKYLCGELEDNLSSMDASQVSFILSASSEDTSERYRDQYILSSMWIVAGGIENLCFHDQVIYRGNNHLTLNGQKTAVSWTEDHEYYAYILDLNAFGAIDLLNIEYQDDRAYSFDSEECEQTMADFRSATNPYLYRLSQDSSGNERLSVKAMENPEGERVDSLLHFLDYDWDHERFPLKYTLMIWEEYSTHIQ